MRAQHARRASVKRRARGFTLVELMVALTGGLFVSIAVFVLAKQASGFYQSEARAGDATFGTLVGFDRLRADIARAGYLVTPNITKDPAICGAIAQYPTAWLQRLASAFIETPDKDIPTVLKANGRKPDQITLAGSYASPDQFETSAIFRNENVDTVYLRYNSPAMVRLGYPAAAANDQMTLLQNVFQTGRILRIVDKTGREQYGVIATVSGGTQPFITLSTNRAPQLEYRLGNANRCGINDLGVGALVNVVNIIRYQLREETDARYAPAINATNKPATDAGRTELVRYEIDATGNEIANTAEVVTELAVDLKFGLSFATLGANQGDQSALTTLLPDDAQIASYAGNPAILVNTGPQLIRSIRARLSVRSREADRSLGIDTTAAGVAPGFYRIALGSNGTTGPYARVRTLQADVALKNQLGVTWR